MMAVAEGNDGAGDGGMWRRLMAGRRAGRSRRGGQARRTEEAGRPAGRGGGRAGRRLGVGVQDRWIGGDRVEKIKVEWER
jgi:hypothetical protein